LHEFSLWPEIWGQESVGFLQASEDGSAEVLSGSGLTGTGGVNIINTCELKNLLGNKSGNSTSTSWGWDHSNGTGTAFSLYLNWDGVDSTDGGTPIASSDWDEVDLGIDQSTLDGNLDFLGALDTNTNVSSAVTGGDDGLESGSLTGLSLLLNGKDAHDLILELSTGFGNELLSDLGLLDWDGVGVDFLEGVDLSVLHESTELGEWSPSVLVSESSTWSTSTSSASTAASAASVSESSSSSATSASWGGTTSWCCLGLSLGIHAYR